MKKCPHYVAISFAVAFQFACGPSTPIIPSMNSVDGILPVNQDDYGDAWPLSASEGFIACADGSSAIFATRFGDAFAMNGSAREKIRAGLEYQEIGPLVLDYPDNPVRGTMLKKSLSPLIDDALELCR